MPTNTNLNSETKMQMPHSTLTRRDFLKRSSVAATVVAVGALDVARTAYAAGGDTLKIGMIGCGGRNSGAAGQALTADPGAKLVAMCDIFRDRIEKKREELRTAKPGQVEVDDDHCFTGFEGYKRIIESSDVVLIANAAKFHPMHLMAAIEAGKHVFVEKPHGIDPVGVKLTRKACDLAREKKLCVLSGLHSRFHAGYQETVNRIREGAIGDIISIEENFLRPPYIVIARDPKLTELQWQCSTQYHFRWLSGDDVVQSLVHNMDRAIWVMNGALPENCHGLGGRSTMVQEIYGDVFDHHSVVYKFSNGVRVYAFCRTTNGCYDESSSLVIGSKGKAHLTNCRITGEKPWRWEGQCDPYQAEQDKLFASIRSGNPINCGDYMANSTLTTIMGQISCYTGKELSWEQVEKSDYFHAPKAEDCRDDMDPPTKPGPDGSYPVPTPGQSVMI